MVSLTTVPTSRQALQFVRFNSSSTCAPARDVDSLPLAGLATQSDADFLRGRYVSANFDVSELLAKKGEIVQNNLLWTRVVGQEQVMPNTSQVHIA